MTLSIPAISIIHEKKTPIIFTDIGHFAGRIQDCRRVDNTPNVAYFDQRPDGNLAVFAVGFDHGDDIFVCSNIVRSAVGAGGVHSWTTAAEMDPLSIGCD